MEHFCQWRSQSLIVFQHGDISLLGWPLITTSVAQVHTSEQCEARYRHVFSNRSHSFPQLVSWSLQQRDYLLNRCLTQLAVSTAYTLRCILFLMPTHCFLDSAGLKYVPWIPTSQLRLESKTVSNQHIKSFQPCQKTIVFNSESQEIIYA